jgi:hypothetical protein
VNPSQAKSRSARKRTGFFITQKLEKSPRHPKMKKKNQPQSTRRPQSVNRQKRNGIMEQWNNRMVDNTVGFPIFQYSIIPIFYYLSLRAL